MKISSLFFLTVLSTTLAAQVHLQDLHLKSSYGDCVLFRIKSHADMSWEAEPGKGQNDCIESPDDEEPFVPADGTGMVILMGQENKDYLTYQTAMVVKQGCTIVAAAWKAGSMCMEACFDSFSATIDVNAVNANGKDISHVELLVHCFIPKKEEDPDDCYDPCETKPPPTTELSLRNAGGYGDPHFLQWDNSVVDFHGACDLILLSSSSIDIHVRTEIVNDWSYIAAAAIRLGQDILEITHHGKHTVNGESSIPVLVGGYEFTYTRLLAICIPFIIFSLDIQTIEITSIDKFLSVMVRRRDPAILATSVGLIGNGLTGAPLTRSGQLAQDVNAYGLEWQVTDKDPALFVKPSGPQWPSKCIIPTPAGMSTIRRRRLMSKEVAIIACAHWPTGQHQENCIQDIILTGEMGLAQVQI